MFGTIRKHQTWLWAIIITLTIVSFVIYFGPVQKLANSRDRGFYAGTIYNEPITKEDYYGTVREGYLEYLFAAKSWYDEREAKQNNFDLDQWVYGRLFLIKKQEEMGVHVSSDLAARVATQMLRAFAQDKPFPPDDFVKNVLKPHGLDYEDFDRYVRHYVGVQELMATIGLSGRLATPQEVKELYIQENQELATEAMFFSASNYLAAINPTPDAVAQYYSNHVAEYRIPERVQVSYVKFAYSNYFGKVEKLVTNLAERVDQAYLQLATNALPEAKTPAEKKEKLRGEFLRQAASPMARNDANQFADPLFGEKPPSLAEFTALAKTNSPQVEVTEPFASDETPKGLDVRADFARVAFSLSATNPYAQPLRELDGVYVIAFNKRVPSEIPSLETIRARVTEDYKMSEATAQAVKEGRQFYQRLTNGLAQGKTFEAVCADAKVKPVELPAFSRATRELPMVEDQLPFNYLRDMAMNTQPGQASPFQETRHGGLVLHVKSLVPIDETKMKMELPSFAASVRQMRQREAFNLWFQREASKGITDAPPLKKEQENQKGPRRAAKS